MVERPEVAEESKSESAQGLSSSTVNLLQQIEADLEALNPNSSQKSSRKRRLQEQSSLSDSESEEPNVARPRNRNRYRRMSPLFDSATPMNEQRRMSRRLVQNITSQRQELYENRSSKKSALICVICLEAIEGQDMASIDSCDHRFHRDCIKRQAECQNTCPLCKARFRVYKYKENGRLKEVKVSNRDGDFEFNVCVECNLEIAENQQSAACDMCADVFIHSNHCLFDYRARTGQLTFRCQTCIDEYGDEEEDGSYSDSDFILPPGIDGGQRYQVSQNGELARAIRAVNALARGVQRPFQ